MVFECKGYALCVILRCDYNFAMPLRRRDKINRWIIELSKIVPSCRPTDGTKNTGSGDSKGGILQKTYQYVEHLIEKNKQLEDQPMIPENASVDQMVQIQNSRIQSMSSEISRLKKELGEARSDRDDIIEQLSKQGIKIKFKEVSSERNVQAESSAARTDYSCGVNYEEVPKNREIQQPSFASNNDFMSGSVEFNDQTHYDDPIEIGNHNFETYENRSHQGSLAQQMIMDEQQIEFFPQN